MFFAPPATTATLVWKPDNVAGSVLAVRQESIALVEKVGKLRRWNRVETAARTASYYSAWRSAPSPDLREKCRKNLLTLTTKDMVSLNGKTRDAFRHLSFAVSAPDDAECGRRFGFHSIQQRYARGCLLKSR